MVAVHGTVFHHNCFLFYGKISKCPFHFGEHLSGFDSWRKSKPGVNSTKLGTIMIQIYDEFLHVFMYFFQELFLLD